MALFMDPQIELDIHSSIIDCDWYYGGLFSPRKCSDVDSILSASVSDYNVHNNCNRSHLSIPENEKCEPACIVEKDARDEQGLTEESNDITNICFESSDFEPAEMCKEDVDDEGECLASMFRVLDENADGRISVEEIVRFLERLNLGLPKEEVELALRLVSACGDDFLVAMEFDEFYKFIFADKEEEDDNVKVEEQTICEAFDVFDENGDGFISAMELANVLRRLGYVEGRDVNCCQSMIQSVDDNGDGFVDIYEFKQLIIRNASTHPCLQCVATVN